MGLKINTTTFVVGFLVLVLGMIMLFNVLGLNILNHFFIVDMKYVNYLFPILIILAGVLILTDKKKYGFFLLILSIVMYFSFGIGNSIRYDGSAYVEGGYNNISFNFEEPNKIIYKISHFVGNVNISENIYDNKSEMTYYSARIDSVNIVNKSKDKDVEITIKQDNSDNTYDVSKYFIDRKTLFDFDLKLNKNVNTTLIIDSALSNLFIDFRNLNVDYVELNSGLSSYTIYTNDNHDIHINSGFSTFNMYFKDDRKIVIDLKDSELIDVNLPLDFKKIGNIYYNFDNYSKGEEDILITFESGISKINGGYYK